MTVGTGRSGKDVHGWQRPVEEVISKDLETAGVDNADLHNTHLTTSP